MSNKNPEQREKLKAWKAHVRAEAEAALPASRELLTNLFDALDQQLSVAPCDHSLRFTLAWAEKMGVNPKKLLEWTKENGGHCDCEVAGNVPETNAALKT
jgi:hypothetical protein